MDPYVENNRRWWDEVTTLHAESAFYDVDGFKDGRTSLDAIELAEVGDVRGRSLLHLQCHFGLSTLSWARLGAEVTGVDFSARAIALARTLAEDVGLDARFLCCNLAELGSRREEQFDIVFSSYGVLCWLPDLEQWAATVARCLRPGGRFHLVELHPTAGMFDDESADLRLRYPYFRGPEPLRTDRPGSYAVPDANTECRVTYSWPTPISDVLTALLSAGLRVDAFREFASCPEPLRPALVEDPDGRWTSPPGTPQLPLVYAVRASRPA